jgi:hypothetical protein
MQLGKRSSEFGRLQNKARKAKSLDHLHAILLQAQSSPSLSASELRFLEVEVRRYISRGKTPKGGAISIALTKREKMSQPKVRIGGPLQVKRTARDDARAAKRGRADPVKPRPRASPAEIGRRLRAARTARRLEREVAQERLALLEERMPGGLLRGLGDLPAPPPPILDDDEDMPPPPLPPNRPRVRRPKAGPRAARAPRAPGPLSKRGIRKQAQRQRNAANMQAARAKARQEGVKWKNVLQVQGNRLPKASLHPVGTRMVALGPAQNPKPRHQLIIKEVKVKGPRSKDAGEVYWAPLPRALMDIKRMDKDQLFNQLAASYRQRPYWSRQRDNATTAKHTIIHRSPTASQARVLRNLLNNPGSAQWARVDVAGIDTAQ